MKIIGLFSRIPLTDLLKSDGMGYYNSAYTVYTVFYTVLTSGLPSAVALLVSQARAVGNVRRAKKTFRTALVFFFFCGASGTLVMFFFADALASVIGNPPVAGAIRAISPSVLLVCLVSLLRGYFQGHQCMLPSAVSQIAEAFGKLGFGLMLAYFAVASGKGHEKAAEGAAVGLTISLIISLVTLMISMIFFRPEKYYTEIFDSLNAGSARQIFGSLIGAAAPITLSSTVLGISGSLDLVTVIRLLKKFGMTQANANSAYGNYSALAVPLFNLPMVLINPIASSILPYLAAARTSGQTGEIKSTVGKAISATALIVLPASLGTCALARPILCLLFDDSLALGASSQLSLLAPATVFLALATVSNSVLQSLGKEKVPVLSMLAGASAKLISSPLLVRKFMIDGIPIGTFICYFTVCLINFAVLARLGIKPDVFRASGYFLFSSVLSSLAASAAYPIFSLKFGNGLSCAFSILTAAAVYTLLIFTDADTVPEVFPEIKRRMSFRVDKAAQK